MSRKKDNNKYWIYGEDATLAARFTKYLMKVLHARRASYVRAKVVETSHEVSIEDCNREIDDVYNRLTVTVEENVESKLMWEGIRNYLPKLTPKECEVMIALYIDRLSVSETAAKLGVEPNTVSTHRRNACEKIRNEMEVK
ncbi:sigma-70 family RNA polymerase sigma factor [Gemmiger sp.]